MNRAVVILVLLMVAVLSRSLSAQTTAFNYQGRLTDAGNPANGAFQMQFKLFDSLGGAGQVGSTIADVPVTVSQATFAVKLDFGSNALSGANRWLEIAVRHNSGESYTTLSPREQIASSPYAVRTLSAASADNAAQLGGVAANQFVQTNDPRLSDARNPLPNSANYIQNTVSPQAASNFNVSGNGTVGSLTANGAVSMTGVTPPSNAPAGQARFFFNSATNKLRVSENGGGFVDLVGSGGVSGLGTANTLPLWNGNTALGNSAVSQFGTNIGIGLASPNGRLGIANSPAWTSHFWGGAIEIENSSAIGWQQNASGYRFGIGRTTDGLVMFRTPVDIGTTSGAPPFYDFKIDNSGNVGIGNTTLNMPLNAKLTLVTAGDYGFENTNGVATMSTYVGQSIVTNTPTGGWLGTRTNHPLYLFANNGAPRMTVATNGNVGIGTTSPNAKLLVASAGDASTSYTARFQSSPNIAGGGGILFDQNSTFGWKIHSENTGFSNGLLNFNYVNISTGASQTSNPLVLTGSGNVGIGTTTPNAALQVAGNVTQTLNSYGLVRAMVFVLANGTVARCYNGITGTSSGNCGFVVSSAGPGFYQVNFGFSVAGRFFSVIPNGTDSSDTAAKILGINPDGTLSLRTFDTNNTTTGENVVSDFYLIVY